MSAVETSIAQPWLTHASIIGPRDRWRFLRRPFRSVEPTSLTRARGEIALLKTQLEEARAEQRHAQTLAREIDHRAKNAFQMAAGMLASQARQAAPEAREALYDAQFRLVALSMAHRAYYEAAPSEPFALAAHLSQLCAAFDEFRPGVHVTLSSCVATCSPEAGSSLGLLVSEAVTNALKHAFGEAGGTVEVSVCEAGDGRTELIVRDDGQGYETVDKIGLGSSLLKALATRLGGRLEIASKTGVGSRLSCKFKTPGLTDE